MIGELGHFCLIVALMLSLAQGVLPWRARSRDAPPGWRWPSLPRRGNSSWPLRSRC